MRYLWPLLLLMVIGVAQAKQVPPADPAELRVATIGAELRCLVCQNQSIADSHADLAADLRQEIREQIKAGKSDRQIRDYMVARYGDFVLYRPPLEMRTVLLWGGPALLALFGIAVLWRNVRTRSAAPSAVPLSEAEQAQLEAQLRQDDKLT